MIDSGRGKFWSLYPHTYAEGVNGRENHEQRTSTHHRATAETTPHTGASTPPLSLSKNAWAEITRNIACRNLGVATYRSR